MTYAAPQTMTMAPQGVEVIDFVNQYGQVVEEDIIYQQPVMQRPLDLLSMGVVISERVISIDELAAEGRYAEAEAVAAPVYQTMAPAPVMYQTMAPAPMVEYMQAPMMTMQQ